MMGRSAFDEYRHLCPFSVFVGLALINLISENMNYYLSIWAPVFGFMQKITIFSLKVPISFVEWGQRVIETSQEIY